MQPVTWLYIRGMRIWIAVALLATITGCSNPPAEKAEPSSSPSVTTTAMSSDEMFASKLRGGGVMATDDQIPGLRPLARETCNAFENSTAPRSDRYTNTVELLQTIGQGKSIFESPTSTSAFIDAAILAYCPDFVDLMKS